MRTRSLSVAAAATTLLVAGLSSQGRGGNANEWPTAYGDAQHSSWIRSDANISVDAMSRPGFALQWKTKVDSPVRGGVSLSQGAVTPAVTLFTPLSTVAGPANLIFALDNDTGNVFWTRRLDGTIPPGTAACPGGISGAPTRIANPMPAAVAPARGAAAGRSGRSYSSAVGEPGAGVPIPARGGAGGGRGAAAPGAPPPGTLAAPAPQPNPAAAGRRQGTAAPAPVSPSPFPTNPAAVAAAGGANGGLFRSSGVIHVVSADGMFRALGLVSGKDMQKPATFLPAGARVSDLIGVGDRVYTTTSHGCGGAPNAIWAINASGDPNTIASWKTNGGEVVGPVAFATNGTLIAAVGPGTVVALDPATLVGKDSFTQPGFELATAPVILQQSGKDIVVVATKDGRIVLLDAASLGGASHATPLFASVRVTTGGATFSSVLPATWQDDATHWLLVSLSTGGVQAFTLSEHAGAFSVQAGWTSERITSPLTPVIINGVVFAASGGTTAPARLYALNGATGQTMWQSGSAMRAPVSGRSLWAGPGQVYVGTLDGTVYAFGFDMERGAPDKRGNQ